MQNPNLKFKLFFLTIIFCGFFGLAKNASAGTAYYVDPTAGGGGDGTYASPWNSLSQVNGHSFSTGDDVYFKANTTLNVPAGGYLDIKWNGTSGDWVIIGSYYGNGQFGLNGGARPIIDGQEAAPMHGSYKGLFDKQNDSHIDAYVEVKDLRLNNSGEAGIVFHYVNYAKATNCYVYRDSYGNGIQAGKSNNVIIDGNTVEETSRYAVGYLGGGIVISSAGAIGMSYNCQVINNTVFNGHGEGIDIISGVENVLVSGNTVYDNQSYYIYCGTSRYVEVKNNVIYRSATDPFSWRENAGIAVDNELEQNMCYVGNLDIHDNYIAGLDWGFSFGSQMPAPCTVNNVQFYDNILADNKYNFIDWGSGASDWINNNIYHNVSYTSNNNTMSHTPYPSSPGVTWGANIFDDEVSGNAAVEACTVPAPLEKTTGWDNLTAGSVTASDFDLSSNGLAGRTACFGGDIISPSSPTGLAVE